MNTISRLLRHFVVVAAVLASSVGLGAWLAPAQAASGVQYCFQYASGGLAYSWRPVFLQAWVNGGWQVIAQASADGSGCGSFRVPAGYRNTYVKVSALDSYYRNGNLAWAFTGSTPLMANAGTAAPYLGNGLVRCVSVTFPCS